MMTPQHHKVTIITLEMREKIILERSGERSRMRQNGDVSRKQNEEEKNKENTEREMTLSGIGRTRGYMLGYGIGMRSGENKNQIDY